MPYTFAGQTTCGYCARWFDVHLYGPMPKWCSGACRQAAYRERHDRKLEARGDLRHRRRGRARGRRSRAGG